MPNNFYSTVLTGREEGVSIGMVTPLVDPDLSWNDAVCARWMDLQMDFTRSFVEDRLEH